MKEKIMKQYKNIYTIVFIVFLIFVGCQKDENSVNTPPPPDRKGSYVGTVADPVGGGALTINIGLAKKVEILPVSGVFRPAAGGTVTLSGTYNTSNDSLYIAGGSYALAGKFSGGQISGVFVGPNGAGIFSVAVSNADNPVKVYTGSFAVPNSANGPFNMLINGATLSGVAMDIRNNESIRFTGTVQGSNLNIVDPARNNLLIATGTISANGAAASGVTYSSSGQQNGTWSGVLVQ